MTLHEGLDSARAIHVEAWLDPVVDPVGHDPRSLYVETFWLPVLGPSTVLLLRFLSRRLEAADPSGEVLIDAGETARSLGLGDRTSRHAPFARTLSRCIDFEMAQLRGADRIEVRRRLPPLARRHLARLPLELAHEHERLGTPTPSSGAASAEMLRQRGRQLALSLVDLGEDSASAERQLLRWRFHPALARDCATWAVDERASSRKATSAAAPAS